MHLHPPFPHSSYQLKSHENHFNLANKCGIYHKFSPSIFTYTNLVKGGRQMLKSALRTSHLARFIGLGRVGRLALGKNSKWLLMYKSFQAIQFRT